MSRRTLLSAEQRDRLFAVPTDPAEMARHYVLGADDLALIRSKRRGMNRLGFAVQLCLLRYPGQGLGPGDHPPEAMIAFVADQVGVPPAAFADYAHRDQTRREHAAELQAALGMRRFGFADWRTCIRVGADAAWATDRGEPIVRAMLEPLRAARVLIPAATVLERIGLIARVRARKKAFQALAAGLTDADARALDGLAGERPGRAPVPVCLAARSPGIARAVEHDRAAGPARICPRSRGRRGSCATHPSRAPQPPGRRGRDHVGAAHRRPRTRAPHRNPGGAGDRARDQARRRDARHVREIHGLAVHQGPRQGRAPFLRRPSATSRRRCCCSGRPSSRSSKPRRPARRA